MDDAFISDELYEKIENDRIRTMQIRERIEWQIAKKKITAIGRKGAKVEKTVEEKEKEDKKTIMINQLKLIPMFNKKNATLLMDKYKSLPNILRVSKEHEKVENIDERNLLRAVNNFYFPKK